MRLGLASGGAAAKVVSAKFRGVSFEMAKFMDENEMPPEITSGTPEMVVTAVLQVMTSWIDVTLVWTSAGRAVLPAMKRGFARGETVGAGTLCKLPVLRREQVDGLGNYQKELCS